MQAAQWSIIPHGINAELKRKTSHARGVDNCLRVLVPGHINGGKGKALLDELLPHLPDNTRLILLGCGDLADGFSSPWVQTIPSYTRENLPDYIVEIEPDLALLASTVPETYGYVLSEMLQLGIPVICSNMGAYAERASALPGILLVEPSAEHFQKALVELRDHPARLDALRRELPFVFPDLNEMAKAWATVLPAATPRWQFERMDTTNFEDEIIMDVRLLQMNKTLQGVYAANQKNNRSIEESLSSINRQQGMLENLLIRQASVESSLHDKDNRITALTDQFAQMQKDAAESLHRIEKQRSELATEVARLSAESLAQQAKMDLLKHELLAMQAKRGWRFLSLFK
jgi:hypothetical protein